jgi:hypothetical protein
MGFISTQKDVDTAAYFCKSGKCGKKSTLAVALHVRWLKDRRVQN